MKHVNIEVLHVIFVILTIDNKTSFLLYFIMVKVMTSIYNSMSSSNRMVVKEE